MIRTSDKPATPAAWRDAISIMATEEGFETVGFVDTAMMPDIATKLGVFIDAGRHGDMDWLADRQHHRAHPKGLWPEANSVVVLTMNYGPEEDPLSHLNDGKTGVISCYARHKDYHDVIKKKLRRIARWLAETSGEDVKIFVDTAPVPEKPLAQQAGLGWQGKHTNLVSRQAGSWLFIGSIYTTMILPADTPEEDHCGGCTACLAACPTDAFPAPYQLDVRRCISYLTIEHKGPIPVEFRKAMGNRIYGCDDCLAACPWNKFAKAAHEAKLVAREDLLAPRLRDLVSLNDTAFRQFFSGSPIKRIGRDRFVRNTLVAIGNSGDDTFIEQVRSLLDDPSALIRGAAIWALGELMMTDAFKALQAQNLPQEADPDCREEWQRPR